MNPFKKPSFFQILKKLLNDAPSAEMHESAIIYFLITFILGFLQPWVWILTIAIPVYIYLFSIILEWLIHRRKYGKGTRLNWR